MFLIPSDALMTLMICNHSFIVYIFPSHALFATLELALPLGRMDEVLVYKFM